MGAPDPDTVTITLKLVPNEYIGKYLKNFKVPVYHFWFTFTFMPELAHSVHFYDETSAYHYWNLFLEERIKDKVHDYYSYGISSATGEEIIKVIC